MKFLKRDAVALTLSYILLHLTVFDKLEYLDSHIAVSIDLSFYTEYSALPLCPNCHPVFTGNPALVLQDDLMIVPFMNVNDYRVQLFASDISPWREMKHDDPMSLPFHTKTVGYWSMKISTLLKLVRGSFH